MILNEQKLQLKASGNPMKQKSYHILKSFESQYVLWFLMYVYFIKHVFPLQVGFI